MMNKVVNACKIRFCIPEIGEKMPHMMLILLLWCSSCDLDL